MAADQWFTTPNDRAESRGRVDLARTSSPGAIAADVLARFRVQAPLITLALRPAELVAWTESVHGGWCELDPRLRAIPFDAASLDVSSCYPLLAHALGWWELITAKKIKRRRVTAALRRLCTRAIDDPTVVLDPAVWAQFGFALVEVIPDGEPFPIEVDDEHRPDGRLEIVPVWSPHRHLFYAWPDVVAAAVRSGRVPHIVRAIKLEPVGRQSDLRARLPFLPGVILDADKDPALAIVRARRAAKTSGDLTLAAELHAAVNALVFGIFWRFDPTRRKGDRGWTDTEVPGPWNGMPIASTVSAGAHLLLAVLDRLVADRQAS